MTSRLYNRQRWRRRRRAFLQTNSLCRMCQEIGRTTLATIVDHITPHKEDERLFFDEANWQSLCRRCHDNVKREFDRTGRLRGCDVNGVPLDPNHHWRTGSG